MPAHRMGRVKNCNGRSKTTLGSRELNATNCGQAALARTTQPIGGGVNGTFTRDTPCGVKLGQGAVDAGPDRARAISEPSSMNLRAADFFTVENFAPAPSSLQRPSVIAEHTGHGCCPSKVDETASATEAVSDRATSIPVHAVPCNNTQCAPLR
jgi:hypothetical protein